MGGRGPLVGLVAIVVLAVVLSLIDARRDSATADEPVHIAAGLTQVADRTWLVNLEHPPLAKALFGLAARAAGGSRRPVLSFRDFFRSARAQLSSGKILLAARLPAVALFAGLLVAVFLAAGGGRAGLFAAVLAAGDTALFPHGHLATTDVPVTLFVVLSVAAALATFGKPGAAPALGAALAAGAACATKYTGLFLLLLLPLLLGAAAVRQRERRRRLLSLAAGVPVLSLLLLGLLLHLLVARARAGSFGTLLDLYGFSSGDKAVLSRLEPVDDVLARYALGLLFDLRQTQAGRPTWFLGRVTPDPPATYQLVALAVKSPAPWLLAVGLGLVLALRRGAPERGRALLLSGLFFLAVSLPGPRIGVRHIFPAVALLTAGAAAASGRLLERLTGSVMTGAVLLALSPLLFGRSLGREGALARLTVDPPLADSNLDWGQDLLRLRALLEKKGIPAAEVSVAYFGGDSPELGNPGVSDLLEVDREPRRYLAVSRQFLLVGPQAALWHEAVPRAARAVAAARQGRLIARAGDSIDLYRLP